MNGEEIARLQDDVKEPAKRLAEDVELFVEGRAVLCRLGKTRVGYLTIFVEHL